MKKQTHYKNKPNPKKYIIIPLLLSFFLFIFLIGVGQSQDPRIRAQSNNCTITDGDYSMDEEEQQVVVLLNSYRQQNNLSVLKVSSSLGRSAAWMARDMATNNYTGQVDKLGRDVIKRFGDCGYGWGTRWELVGQAQQTANSIFGAWKNTESTNKTLLQSNAKVLGIARVLSTNGVTYWTLALGSNDDSGSGTVPTTALSTVMPTVFMMISPTVPPPTQVVTPSMVCLGCSITPGITGAVVPTTSSSAPAAIPLAIPSGGSLVDSIIAFFNQIFQSFMQLFP